VTKEYNIEELLDPILFAATVSSVCGEDEDVNTLVPERAGCPPFALLIET
jgi:hypothetical protein